MARLFPGARGANVRQDGATLQGNPRKGWLPNLRALRRRVAEGTAAHYIAASLALVAVAQPSETSARSPAPSAFEAIRHRGVLRVAVLDEYPWLKEVGGASEPFDGPAWTIAKEAARRLHVHLVTVRVTFDDKLKVLDDGRVDATVAPLLATPERIRQYGMVTYSHASQCLFGRRDNSKLSKAHTLDELNRPDLTIAVVAGTPQGRWLRQRLPQARVREVSGNITTVPTDDIVSRRADVATIDQYFFAATSRKVPGLVSLPFGTSCLDSQELTIPIGLAVNRGSPELKALFSRIVTEDRATLATSERRVIAAGP